MDSESISSKAAAASLVALVLIAVFLLLWHFPGFFLLVFAGILFGVFLAASSRKLASFTGMPYGMALTLVLLFLAAIISAGIWLLAPTVSQQTDELLTALERAIARLRETLSATSWGRQLLSGIPDKPQAMLGGDSDLISRLTGIFSSTLNLLANLVIVVVTGIYLAAAPQNYRTGFIKLITPSYRTRIDTVLEECYQTLKNWLKSRFITMMIVGILTGIGLILLGIPLPWVLAIIAAFFNFIPNVGPLISAVPALLIAFLDGPQQALYVALLYFGIQSLEGYVLTPLLDRKFASIPPAMNLFGLVLLGLLAGLGGIFLAAPLVAVLIVIVNELYVKDYLESKALNRNSLRKNP